MKQSCTLWLFALLALAMPQPGSLADTGSVASKSIPKPREDPQGWFSACFKIGQPGPALWSPEQPPQLLPGAEIMALMEAATLISGIVARDPELKKSLLPGEKYWYWTRQGPMSNRQMHVILKGPTLPESLIVYARLQERECF